MLDIRRIPCVVKLSLKININPKCWLRVQTLTVQFAAQQLQSQAHALGGGSLRVDPDKAGEEGTRGPQLRGVVVLVPDEYLRGKEKRNKYVMGRMYFT